MGPTQDYVLGDLEAWLKDPVRKVRSLDSQLQTAEGIMEELRDQLGELNSELNQQTRELENQVSELQSESTDMQNTVAEVESDNMDLRLALDSARNNDLHSPWSRIDSPHRWNCSERKAVAKNLELIFSSIHTRINRSNIGLGLICDGKRCFIATRWRATIDRLAIRDISSLRRLAVT